MRKELQTDDVGNDASAYKSYICLGDQLVELPDERVKIAVVGEVPLVVHPRDDDWYYRDQFSNEQYLPQPTLT